MPLITFKLPGGKKVDVSDTPSDGEAVTFNSSKDLYDAQAGGGGGQTFAKVVKSTDEIVNNSTTLQDDDELFVALNANKTYLFVLYLYYDATSVADLDSAWTVPAGATGDRILGQWRSDAVIAVTALSTQIGNAGAGGGGFVRTAVTHGRVITAGTAGDLQFQWAQMTAEVSDTKVLQAATLLVWEEA